MFDSTTTKVRVIILIVSKALSLLITALSSGFLVMIPITRGAFLLRGAGVGDDAGVSFCVSRPIGVASFKLWASVWEHKPGPMG